MKFIDTHIHLQDYKSKSATQIIRESLSIGAEKLICVATCENDWDEVAKIYEQFPDKIIPAFGIHPWAVAHALPKWEQRLASKLENYPHALVGECGLDRYRDKNAEPQQIIFKTHIELAKVYQRPMIIHAVKAQDWLENFWSLLPSKFVFHSYCGHSDMVKKIISRGGYVSFSASILKSKFMKETVKSVPLNKILLETDGPYQPFTGFEESHPSFIPELADRLAEIRAEKIADFSSQIYQNSLEFIKKW